MKSDNKITMYKTNAATDFPRIEITHEKTSNFKIPLKLLETQKVPQQQTQCIPTSAEHNKFVASP